MNEVRSSVTDGLSSEGPIILVVDMMSTLRLYCLFLMMVTMNLLIRPR